MMLRTLLLAFVTLLHVQAEGVDGNRRLPPGCVQLRNDHAGPIPESVELRGGDERASQDGQLFLYLRKATGSLKMNGPASCDTYQAYFHVPIPFREQAPILLQISCPQMIDYRFVHEDPPNLLVAARLLSADSAVLDWTSWVIVKQNSYPDFPTYIPIPDPDELPDSVRPWLDTTDCCQVSASVVQYKADSLRDTTTNLIKLAQDICTFCHNIPWQFPHTPYAFDAVYALKWGNSCTGKAHAATALLRANGVPARPLLNILAGTVTDMHWIVDYYVPGYGWVRMESASGVNPMAPQDEIVVRVCNPGDEFPVWYPWGIDAEWHTSDTALEVPGWGGAHYAYAELTIRDSSERVDYAIALTDSVYDYYASYWGIRLPAAESAAFLAGLGHQTAALERIQARDLPGYIDAMQQALLDYQGINLAPVETLYSEDFETGPAGWTHGGSQDEWELGVPTYGPTNAHSGQNCWGTNLDGPYANRDDCWLMSPPIDLSGLANADFSFWIWNSVQDFDDYPYDPVWVEISRDGAAFVPFCSRMAGVNDDPEITAIGGWSHVFLDLAHYLGDTVQFRFRFRSNNRTVFAGSYIDDVKVSGRRSSAGIAETPDVEVRTANQLPTVVRGVLFMPGDRRPGTGDRAALLDIAGRKALDLNPGTNDVRTLAPGVYFVRGPKTEDGRPSAALRKVVVTR